MTKRTKKFSREREENWKDQRLQPCRAKDEKSITKVIAKPNSASEENSKTIYSCKVESYDSTRQRVESSLPAKHEDHIASHGFTSMTHYKLVHKFIRMPQALKISDAQTAVDKEWKKLEKIPARDLGKKQEQKGGHSGSTKRQQESSLCHTERHMSPQKKTESEPK